MGWLRLVRAFKSYVSFAEYSLFYMALWQKNHESFVEISYQTAMGWLRLVGAFKLYVSFAEYSLLYRALLQKIPIILIILPIVATPILHF